MNINSEYDIIEHLILYLIFKTTTVINMIMDHCFES